MYVGQTFTFRRTVTDSDVAPFCGVTGDYNPYHQDETFPAKAKPSILHLQVIRLLAAVRLLPLVEPVRR
jgi:acyl dehydratase